MLGRCVRGANYLVAFRSAKGALECVRVDARTLRSRSEQRLWQTGCVADPLPGLAHVFETRVRLSDGHPQGEVTVQFRVRQIQPAGVIQSVQQPLVRFVPTPVAETDQIEHYRSGQFEVVVVLDPLGEMSGQLHVLANQLL